MYQHVVFDGTNARYEINVPVNQRTLAAAFDMDNPVGSKFMYGSGAIGNSLFVSAETWQARVNSSLRVDGSGVSSESPGVVIHSADATTIKLRINAELEQTAACTTVATTFTAIGANSPFGGSLMSGKFFGGTIVPGHIDTATDAALRTFLGALVGLTI